MVHKKGDLGIDNKRPHILHIPTSTQDKEYQKSDKDSIKSHITIIAEILKIVGRLQNSDIWVPASKSLFQPLNM